MVTALLIVLAVVLVLALVGVCCQIAGGGFGAVMHVVGNTPGLLLGLLAEVVAGIFDGFKS